MQCLHCGKELALLKRLTGAAEFCSDAHRKKYQEEFNDLALSRLLQSHPKGAPHSSEAVAMGAEAGLPEPSRDPLNPTIGEPCHPAGEPKIWLAVRPPATFEPIRLDFDVIRSGEAIPEISPPPPPMHAQPLPVTLQAVGPGFAKPVAVIGDALPPRLELPEIEVLAPQGLPLRPAIVLRPKPAELSSAAAVTESVGARRPEAHTAPSVRELPKLAAPVPREEPKPARLSPISELGLPELRPVEDKGIWARMPAVVKIGLAAAIVLGIGGFAYLTLNSTNATAKSIPARPVWSTGRQINMNGWIEDWAPLDPLRRVTLLRGTESLSNYRLEFTAQIQTKAVGWMFRGLNPKNYYVAKIEKIKPGLEPVVAFVRYAVIDGKNEGRIEKILPIKARADTSYKVRFEATGSRFSVWILGEKVEEWEDARLGSGGLGLYSESGEAPALHGSVNAWELMSNAIGQ